MSGSRWTPEELAAAVAVLRKHDAVIAAVRDPEFPRRVSTPDKLTAPFRNAGLSHPRSYLRHARTAEVAPTHWGKGTAAEKRQEYNRDMGRTADLLGDVARGAEPDPDDSDAVAAYVSRLADEERRMINRQRARSASLGAARETLFVRQFQEACKHLPMKVVPKGYAATSRQRGGKRTVNLLLSDLHFGANLDRRELPIGYDAHTEARRFAKVVLEARDYKPQYREQTHLNILANGDLIDGLLGHDLRDGDPLTDQFTACLSYFAQAITLLAASYPTVHVEWQSGNHGRNKLRHPHRATSSKWDSFESMIGIAVREACKPLANVTFTIALQPYGRVELHGQWLLVTHGDTFINLGRPDKSIDIRGIGAQLDAINSSGEYGGPFAVFACGHVHFGARLQFQRCSLLINPALMPPGGFARSVGVHAQSCGQWLWESVEGHPVGDERLIMVGPAEDADASLESTIAPMRFSGEG